MGTLEKTIALVITLLTFSLISEKVINWIKLYFGQEGKKLLFFSNKHEDITKQLDDPEANTKRTRKILGLNIVVCCCLALLMKGNLFDLLNSKIPAENLGWYGFTWSGDAGKPYLICQTIFGCLLTGLCMSMGSKFWHDTLDMLFYAKDLRKKLSEKETYTMRNATQLTQWMNTSRNDIVKQVLNDNRPKIMILPDVVTCGITTNTNGEEIIEIVTKNSTGYPTAYSHTLPNGLTLEIPVVIRQVK